MATITLPVDNSNYYYYYPYGFSIAPDGTFWCLSPTAAISSTWMPAATSSPATPTGGYMPESASIGTDGNVYFSTTIGNVYQLNPTTDGCQPLRHHRLTVWHSHQHSHRRHRHLGRGLL